MPNNETHEFDAWLSKELGTDSRADSCIKLISDFLEEEKALEEFIKLYKKYRGEHFGKIFKPRK